MGSLMYAMLYTRLKICFVIRMMSKYQSNSRLEYKMTINHILKYLRRMRDYIMVYHCKELVPLGYMDSDFQLDKDFCKSTSWFIFTLGGRAISWRSVKQSCNFTIL